MSICIECLAEFNELSKEEKSQANIMLKNNEQIIGACPSCGAKTLIYTSKNYNHVLKLLNK